MKYFPLYLLITGATPHTQFHFGRVKQECDCNHYYGSPMYKCMYITHVCKHLISVMLTQACPCYETAAYLILVRHFPAFFEVFLQYYLNVVTQPVTRTKPYIFLHISGLLQRDLHQ